MADPQTANKALFTPPHNADVDVWEVPVNANWQALDLAFGGSTSLNAGTLSGNQALTVNQYTPLTLIISGTPSGAITYVVPSGVGGQWVVSNSTSGGQTVGIASAAGGSTVVIPAGTNLLVSCDGTSRGMVRSISTPPAAAGSNTQVQYNSSGLLAGSAGLTFDGTILTATGLNIAGNTTLGSGAGSTLTLNGTAVSTPNKLNLNAGQFYLDNVTGNVGIGITTPLTSLLTVAGSIKSTTGGFVFPDATVQTTAATSTSIASAYATVSGTTATIRAGTGIASIVNQSPGVWQVNFTTPMVNTFYRVNFTASAPGNSYCGELGSFSRTTSAFQIYLGGDNAPPPTPTAINLTVFA